MPKYTLHLGYDPDCESPEDGDLQWRVISFNRRHRAYENPYDHLEPMSIGLRRKLQVGTAFLLGYYEHGLCQWALSGEQHSCPWDSVNVAGLLLWEHDPKELPKTYAERERDARSFLEAYTDWANGQCFWYSLEDDETGALLDCCGGFIGSDHFLEAVREALPEDADEENVEVIGEAKDLADYLHLPAARRAA